MRKAALWYWQPRKREWINIDDALRQQTFEVIDQTREMVAQGNLPPARYKKECKSCSLEEQCQPRQKDKSLAYTNEIFNL